MHMQFQILYTPPIPARALKPTQHLHAVFLSSEIQYGFPVVYAVQALCKWWCLAHSGHCTNLKCLQLPFESTQLEIPTLQCYSLFHLHPWISYLMQSRCWQKWQDFPNHLGDEQQKSTAISVDTDQFLTCNAMQARIDGYSKVLFV